MVITLLEALTLTTPGLTSLTIANQVCRLTLYTPGTLTKPGTL